MPRMIAMFSASVGGMGFGPRCGGFEGRVVGLRMVCGVSVDCVECGAQEKAATRFPTRLRVLVNLRKHEAR